MEKKLPDSGPLPERFPYDPTMRPAAVLVAILAITFASCSSSDTAGTTAGSTATTADPSVGTPATDQAVAAGEAFRAAPDGYRDCGHTNLSSGWPTTTVFNSEIGAVCISDAATSGTQAQQSFSGRDNAGGLDGRIVRVQGIEEITVITYHVDPRSALYRVDPDGTVSSDQVTCRRLVFPISEPPSCGS